MAEKIGKIPKYDIICGLKFPKKTPVANVESGLKYKPKDDDLFVDTYMKSGTTWIQQICTLIFSDGELTPAMKEKGLYNLSPFLEFLGAEAVESIPNPKIIKTHLPFQAIPYNPKAKYIYVARNPKDVLVSFYHHCQLLNCYEFNGTIHDILPLFLKGDVVFGSYVDHVLSWWEHRDDSNVLFLLYEDMKTDIRSEVRKVAEFMGDDYKRKMDSKPEILEKIVNYSDISFMKETTNKNYEYGFKKLGLIDENREFNFVRKGVIGDWKNELTADENKEMEEWFEASFKNTGVYNLWCKYGIFDHKI